MSSNFQVITKRFFLLTIFFIIISVANGQSEYQTNYYDLITQVREVTKRAYEIPSGSKSNEQKLLDFRKEIFKIIKLAYRLEEEASNEALKDDKDALSKNIDNSSYEKVLDDIAFGCNICETLLHAVDLKIKSETKDYDTYIERLKSLELGITLQIKTQEIIK